MRCIQAVAAAAAVGLCLGSAAKAGETPPQRSEADESPKEPSKRLAIVAPERFHAALEEFVRHKTRLVPTEVVSLEKVLGTSPGVDDPERLKRFLYARWREHHLGYALLVGDVDVMPVRYMVLDRVTPAAFDYAFYPSDLYFADLAGPDGTFDDWNARKESFHGRYFGEVRGEKNKLGPINYDQVHYRPEIAVGRWPVSTPEEVRRVAAKSMAYETGVLAGTRPGLRRAALVAVGGWVDARGRMDRWGARLQPGWTIEKRYYADGSPNKKSSTPPPDERQLLALLGDGVGLVIHTGHGTDMSWQGCFSVRSLDRLANADRLPVMISAGCSTAAFAPLAPYAGYVDADGGEHRGSDQGEVFSAPPPPPAPYQKGRYNPTGLGEQLLRRSPNGAVAYIGCNTGSQPCALTLVEGFVIALAEAREPRLGDCWTSAVSYYYGRERLDKLVPTPDWYPASIFFQGMKFMLFGDPTLRLP